MITQLGIDDSPPGSIVPRDRVEYAFRSIEEYRQKPEIALHRFRQPVSDPILELVRERFAEHRIGAEFGMLDARGEVLSVSFESGRFTTCAQGLPDLDVGINNSRARREPSNDLRYHAQIIQQFWLSHIRVNSGNSRVGLPE